MDEESGSYSWTEWLKQEVDRNKNRPPQQGRKGGAKRVSGRFMYKKLVELGAVDPESEAEVKAAPRVTAIALKKDNRNQAQSGRFKTMAAGGSE